MFAGQVLRWAQAWLGCRAGRSTMRQAIPGSQEGGEAVPERGARVGLGLRVLRAGLVPG